MNKLGFDCRYRYLSTFNQTPDIINSVADDYLKVKPKLEQVVRMEAMTPKFWLDHLDEIYGFVDQVFGANFAYTAISAKPSVRPVARTLPAGSAPPARFSPAARMAGLPGSFWYFQTMAHS